MTRALALVVLPLALGGGARAASSGSVSASVVVSPLDVVLTLAPAQVAVGQYAAATATVRNLGASPLSGATATLRLDPGLTVAGSATRPVAPIAVGGSAQVAWIVCAAAPGSYLLIARAQAGSANADSSAQLLLAQAAPGSCPASISPVLATCQLTKQFVQGSARYQALPRRRRAAVDALANSLCSHLAQIAPGQTPAQKAAAIDIYKLGVQALVAVGWLTQSQADTLEIVADGL